MGVLLCLDFFALRAGKPQELLRLRDSGARRDCFVWYY